MTFTDIEKHLKLITQYITVFFRSDITKPRDQHQRPLFASPRSHGHAVATSPVFQFRSDELTSPEDPKFADGFFPQWIGPTNGFVHV